MFERVTVVLSPISLNFRPLKELLHTEKRTHTDRQRSSLERPGEVSRRRSRRTGEHKLHYRGFQPGTAAARVRA